MADKNQVPEVVGLPTTVQGTYLVKKQESWFQRNKTIVLSFGFTIIVILLCIGLPFFLLRNSSNSRHDQLMNGKVRNVYDGPKEIHYHIQGKDLNNFSDLKDMGKSTAVDSNDIDIVKWDDVVGQEKAKQALRESAVWPRLRPELFVGARQPPKGILLFGPPGTGKTMLAKAVATNLDAKFIPITGAEVNDKWFGESEKIVKILFEEAAKAKNGCVIFIDEIDALLRTRNSDSHEATLKVTTQFLTSLDGVLTKSDNNKILVIGATNRPYDLDEAALRRFPKRIRVGLPEKHGVELILKHVVSKNHHSLTDQDFTEITEKAFAKNYNASDVTNMGKYAAMEAIRWIKEEEIKTIPLNDPRLTITRADFEKAVKVVQTSVNDTNCAILDAWEKRYGAD